MSKYYHPTCKPMATVLGVVVSAGALLLLPSCANSGFDMADSDDDGSVSPAEFDRFMLESIYAEADTDYNKEITFDEWKAANPGADPTKFSAPDTNGDDVVTPEEAQAHFEKTGTLDDLFGQMDSDEDGAVTEAEAIAFKEKLAAQSGSTDLEKLSNLSQQK